MLSLLDRYIARQFLVNIVALFLILFSFIIAVDVAINIDRLWNRAGEILAERDADGSQVLLCIQGAADLWWPRILQLFNFINGIVLAAAMGFTCAQLVKHRELVAVLASGQSLRRVLRPIIVIAACVQIIQLANQELVMPRIAHLLTRDHGDAGKRLLGTVRLSLTPDSQGRLLYAETFDADAATLTGVHIWVRDDAGRLTNRITADVGRWDGLAWALENGVQIDAATGDDHTPRSIDRFETDLDPTALRMKRYKREIGQNLSWAQLGEMLSRGPLLDKQRRDELIRLKYGRITAVLTHVLVLVICAPLFILREPGGVLARALRAAPIAIVGLLGGVLASSTPIPGLPALLGVALPVIVLAPLAVASISSMRT
jgi:lipopolysaccharide export LptBFGC system permease protein LptF